MNKILDIKDMKRHSGPIGIKNRIAIDITTGHGLLLVLIIVVFASCSKDGEKDPLLVEAFEVHERSLSMAKDVREVLDEMPESDSVTIRIEKKLKAWEGMVVEVPGFEHNHDHGHHHHGTGFDLTPQQILDIQIELQDSIAAIKEYLIQHK